MLVEVEVPVAVDVDVLVDVPVVVDVLVDVDVPVEVDVEVLVEVPVVVAVAVAVVVGVGVTGSAPLGVVNSEDPPLKSANTAPVIATHTPEETPEPVPPVLLADEEASSDALGSSNASEFSSPSEAIDFKLVPLRTSVSIEKYVPSFLKNSIFNDPLLFEVG